MAVAGLLRRTQADALVREMHLKVHRYPADFAGFRARLELVDDQGSYPGEAILRFGQAPEALGAAGGEGSRRWLLRELDSLAAHRRHLPYEEGDGRFDKDVCEGRVGALGAVVSVADPMLSSYWIRDGRLARISRTMGSTRLSILIQETATAPDGNWVATHFTVVYQDAAGGEIASSDIYSDRYVERWGLLLPAVRRVVTISPAGSLARELRLSDHAPLDAAAVPAPAAREAA